MVLAVNPEMVLVKLPVPVPSDVLLSEIVGNVLTELQQTPLAVTAPPPSDVTFPPPVAETDVIDVAKVVVMVGITAEVLVDN